MRLFSCPGATSSAKITATPTRRPATPTRRPATAVPTRRPATAVPISIQAQIATFQFNPKELQVNMGTRITWTNMDDIEHSVTSGSGGTPSGVFDSGLFTKGKTFTFTFSKAGSYSYFCSRHPSMTGNVTVK